MLKVERVPIDSVRVYAKNAKLHPAEQIEQIKKSIQDFGNNDPIAVWGKDSTIVEGHGRYIALKELGYEEVDIIRLDHLSDEQRRAYALVHNKLTMNSPFDIDMLQLELDSIDIDMTEFGFEFLDEEPYQHYDEGTPGNLQKRFTVPPFSVLDARQGYWKDRKQEWLKITGNLSETRNGEFGKFGGGSSITDSINEGTSNFDPVLAEIMYKWFCVEGGKVLDPFGGEQTKGVIAGELGYTYRGCEIRREQVELNNRCTAGYENVKYYCGDSNEIADIIPDRDFDMCFTSPPYYDLEVYSTEDMSALGTYEEFMAMYRNIFKQCFDMMRDGSFLVVKVGEIRDKKTGAYRCFVADNIKIMCEIGFIFYNDLVLVTAFGTAPLRATNGMRTRKCVKTHQNILVFYKGNTKDIANRYERIDFENIDEDEVE